MRALPEAMAVGPTFRDADLTDLPAIVALLADDVLGGGREASGEAIQAEAAYAAGFLAMQAQGGRIVLAVLGGEVVGCLQLNILHGVSQRGMTRAQVEGVRVAGALRGRGLGAALMQEAIRRARAAGARSMQLTTNQARTDAQRFYRGLGFEQTHAGLKLTLK